MHHRDAAGCSRAKHHRTRGSSRASPQSAGLRSPGQPRARRTLASWPALHQPNGPTAPGTDHLAVLIEEHVIVNHEQPLFTTKLVQCARLKGDASATSCGDVVAPG